ncbi:hypothetical protein [Chryseobacterium indologenes]|uniref:hypothetical protein n=1 Tax=Chryseobacterium indologenes TaxID=253 RepID=UPI001BCEEA8E|nr:hypothetical protein [Chryseobacterium indologenes]
MSIQQPSSYIYFLHRTFYNNIKTTNEIIIIDLEATCWENDRIPIGQKVDIIEIGICKLNLTSKVISQKQSIYVIPERSEINNSAHS